MTESVSNQPSSPHSILLCTAVSAGFSPHYEAAVDRLGLWCRERGIVIQKARVADAPVDAARDALAAQYLAATHSDGKPFSHMLMVDASVGFAPETVAQLLEADEMFTAVAVPVRQGEDGRFNRGFVVTHTRETRETGKVKLVKKGEAAFLEIDSVGAALICIRRTVLQRMFDAYPELQSSNDPVSYFLPGIFDRDGLTYTERLRRALERVQKGDLLSSELIDKVLAYDPSEWDRCGEDISFCRRWRALHTEDKPARIWLLAEATIIRSGNGYFMGNYAESELGAPGK
jgi:hypothetical protein